MPELDNRHQGKIIRYKLDNEEGESELFELTHRMARGLLSTIEYFKWLPRHMALPTDLDTQAKLDTWVSDLADKLMSPFDPLAEICSRIIDCIENDTDVQNTLREFVRESVPLPSPYPLGQVNPALHTNLAEGTNEGCNLDILWSQCLAIAKETNLAILDVLQKVEVVTNSVELANAVSEFPIVGWAKDLVGASMAVDLAEFYQEAVAESYEAQYTETVGGLQDQIACAIFCACKHDCVITIDRVYEVMATRLGSYITVPDLEQLLDILQFATGTSFDGTYVVDMMFFFAWGTAKLGSFFFGKVFDNTLQLLLLLSVNDANDDHLALCVDCPTPLPENCFPFNVGKNGWEVIFGGDPTFGSHVSGGWITGTGGLIIELEVTEGVTSVTVDFDAPVANVIVRALGGYGYAALSANSASSLSSHTLTITGDGSHGLGIWIGSGEMTTQKLTNICYEVPEE